ncbi:unannotated protein [freshwater metagenome]|jgi:F0F1-type ATP synthase assembly protein I|uniref:Unannotated protein n=1 Tax=freshwater metagenome TaxID=449393 RepID=A0A6J6TMA9_9ZZZZ|nr:AtpZ/AtpI family protein [Nocardioides sp.]MSY84819.1 hypothetical protein [Actinomycetota bacterium]
MAPDDSRYDTSQPSQDPWRAFSYLVAGVLLYGVLGWLADRWLGTSFLVAVGILLGAGLGMYMVFKTFGAPPADSGGEQ